MKKIDLEKRTDNEYVPKQYSFNNQQVTILREMFVGYNVEKKREQFFHNILFLCNDFSKLTPLKKT